MIFVAFTVSATCYVIANGDCGEDVDCEDFCISNPVVCRYEYEVVEQFTASKCSPNPSPVPPNAQVNCVTAPESGTDEACYTQRKCSSNSTVVCPTDSSQYVCQPSSGSVTTVMKKVAQLSGGPCA